MKKLMLIVSLLFTINLSAVQDWGNVSANSSGCANYKWDRYTLPQANTCYDINQVLFHSIRWNGNVYDFHRFYSDNVKGYTSSTHYDLEGNAIYIAVDVFGVPSDEPTVMYKYKTLPLYATQNIINHGIINGTRYWFEYLADRDWGKVNSGDIIVKEYATEKDRVRGK
jgi:hypothetical protein